MSLRGAILATDLLMDSIFTKIHSKQGTFVQ